MAGEIYRKRPFHRGGITDLDGPPLKAAVAASDWLITLRQEAPSSSPISTDNVT